MAQLVDPPRVAVLIPCLLTGGTEVATLETAMALHALGFAVEVVVYFDEVDATMLRAFESSGVRVRCLRLQRGAGVFAQLRLAWALAHALWRGPRPALVWLQYLTPTLLPLLVARPFTRRLVATVHVAAEHFGSRAQRRLRWLAAHWCDRVVCVSDTTATSLFGADAAARTRIAVIANAVDTDAARDAVPVPWRERAGWPEHAMVVGYVGRFATIKGPDLLLEAFALLASEHDTARLVLVGGGAEDGALRAQASRLGISDRVHFAGPLPRMQVFSALRGFDLAVVPSREEGFGLSAAEAMAAGIATVATDVGALPEVLAQGRIGVLVAPESPAALAQGMAALLDDPVRRATLATAAAADIARRYGRDALRRALAALCDELGVNVEAGR